MKNIQMIMIAIFTLFIITNCTAEKEVANIPKIKVSTSVILDISSDIQTNLKNIKFSEQDLITVNAINAKLNSIDALINNAELISVNAINAKLDLINGIISDKVILVRYDNTQIESDFNDLRSDVDSERRRNTRRMTDIEQQLTNAKNEITELQKKVEEYEQ